MTRSKTVLLSLLVLLAWLFVAGHGGVNGWWLSSKVQSDSPDDFGAWAVGVIQNQNPGNTAFALLQDGEVVNEYYAPSARIDKDTLFPVASLSKWLAAMAVLILVEEEQLDLDTSIESYLTRWQLPDHDYDHPVTVRQLLSHTAGLTDNLGFGDYSSEETVPSIDVELRQPRSSQDTAVSIVVGAEPGAEFIYSGGGYLILELIVEEVSGENFSSFVQKNLLTPLGMHRSSYDFIGNFENASQNIAADGSPAPSYQYASAAATGLISTAADLSRMIQSLTASEPPILSQAILQSMREPEAFVFGAPIWGLGTILYAKTANGDFVFGHEGVNDPAINASVRVNPDSGDAIILLINGHPDLATKIASEWTLWQTGYPDFLSIDQAIKSSVVPGLVGSVILILGSFLLYRKARRN